MQLEVMALVTKVKIGFRNRTLSMWEGGRGEPESFCRGQEIF